MLSAESGIKLFVIRQSTKKKRFNIIKYISLFNIVFLLAFGLIFFLSKSDCSASNSEKKLQEIQDKLKSKLDALKETSYKEKSVTKKLDEINKNIGKKERELDQYSTKIEQTQSEIQSLTDQVDVISGKLKGNIEYLEEIVVAFYKKQYDSNALVLLSASDYQDLIQKLKYTSLIAHYDGNVINQYGDEIKRMNEKKQRLEALQKERSSSINNAKKRKIVLQKESQKKDKLLASLKAKRNEHEKNIKELENSSQKVLAMLKNIKSQSLPQSIVGKGFKTLKGLLPWPVDGKILIPYGENKKVESGTSVFKSGIEIKAQPEDIVEAVAGGRVVYADEFKGYGKLVIIDHGNGYHSLYGNLSGISLEKGNIVLKGFEVGNVLTSKILNIPTLYFEIRHRGKPVNPMDWLSRQIKNKA